MNNIRIVLTIAAVVAVDRPVMAGAGVRNLAPNPSFEARDGWSFWAWASKGIKATSSPVWDAKVARTGKSSIRTQCPGGSHTGVWDNEHAGAAISVKGGTVYRCEVWVKVEVPEGKRLTARITIGFRDADKGIIKAGKKSQALTFTATADWTRMDLRVPAPARARLARIDLVAVGAGTAWFDDVLVVASEAASQAVSGQGAYVTWPRASVAPSLDGKLDDRCWRQAALLTDFMKVGGREFPRNPTAAYLLYDETALYIGMRCQEWVLNPVRQLRHSFRASQKERDGNVFADDCVEVFVDPKGDGHYYQFAFNALATRYDGVKFDKAWDGQWRVATAIGDEAWTAELAIPFADLGVEPQKQMRFRFNVCRQEKPNQENSTWAPIREGFHEPANFATGILGERAVQVELHNLPQLMEGAGKQSAALTVRNASDIEAQTGLYFSVVPPSGRAQRVIKSHPAQARSQETVQFPFVQEEGSAFKVSLSVVDETADKLLLRTPAYRLTSSELPRGVLSKALRDTSKAWINGEPILGDTFVLRRGTNVVALQRQREAGRGAAGSVRILPNARVAGQEIPLDDCWKVSAVGQKDWRSPEFDDRAWEYAARRADGSVWSADPTSTEICLRRVLVVQWSRFQAVDVSEGLHVARGASQHAPLGVGSPKPLPYSVQQLVVDIQTPADLRLVGVRDETKLWTDYLRLKHIKQTEGATVTTTEFRCGDVPLADKSGRLRRLGLVLNLASQSEAESLEVRYRCRGEESNRNVTELWNRLPVVCLPALADKRPSTLLTQIFHSWFMPCTKSQMAGLMDTWRQAGFNSHGNSTAKYVRSKPCPWLGAARAKEMTIFVEGPHPSFFAPILKAHPNARMVNFDGPSHNLHCPVAPIFLIEQGRAQYRKEIADFVRRTGAAGFHWDLEYGPFDLCDIMPRSLKKFAERAKLDHVPTKEEVKERYRTEWIDFMCRLWAEVGKVIREGLKEANPKAVFSIYSGYQSAYSKTRYAIDWNYFRGIVDLAAMGYGRQPMAETFQALPGTPLQLGVLCYYRSPPGTYRSLKTKLLRRITDGGRSVMLFEWSALDGRAYQKISQAIAVLADFETFFLKNEKTDQFRTDGDIRKEDVVMLADGGARLLLIFNDDPDQHKKGSLVLQDIPAGRAITSYPASTRLRDAALPLAVTVPPNDVVVFHVPEKR